MIRFFTPNENNNARFIGWWRGCQNGLTGIVGRDAASGGKKAAILPGANACKVVLYRYK